MVLCAIDVAIVVVSVLSVVSFGVWASRSRKTRDESSSEDYFLAGRCMPHYVVAASLFAANVGSEQFIGMAGTAAKSGIAVAMYELSAPYLLILLGWVFAPLYSHCNIRTTPEYLEKRFNKTCRLVFVCVLIATHILATISATLYAGSVVLEVVTGLTIWQSAPIIVLLTAVYTISGGLKAVMLTDALQSVILLTGGVVGSLTALNLVGGINGLFEKLESVELSHFPHLIRPLNDRDFPWLGTCLALFIGGMRYWCLDQEMAQRVLSAKNLHHARLGTAGAGILKLLPLFIIILPGMVARLLFELCQGDESGSTFPEWCQTQLDSAHEANKAYPLLVLHEFPPGVKGLMIASFLAAMMSSLASLFNSVSAMFTYDIYIRFFCRNGPSQLLGLRKIGRFAVAGLVALTFAWIPVIDSADRGLFIVASEILHHLGPPITAVFACGIFLRRVNGEGAVIGLLTGSIVGAIRLILFLVFQDTCDHQVHGNHQSLTWSNWVLCLNFHYFSPFLFAATVGVVISASRFYSPPSEEHVEGHVITFAFLADSCRSPPSDYTKLDACADVEKDRSAIRSPQEKCTCGGSDGGSSARTSEGFGASTGRAASSEWWSLSSAIVLPFVVLGTATWLIYLFH